MLDGSKTGVPPVSNLCKRLHSFIKSQCRSFDIDFKLVLLSWDKELDKIPDEDFLSSKNISKRGRFITPLVEDIFYKLREKKYDLIILSAGKIYDWEDWQDEINTIFNRVHFLNPDDLEQKAPIQLENELIESIFDFKIDKIIISFKDSLCYDFPNGFNLNIEEGKLILTKDFDSRLVNIDLKPCGLKDELQFIVEACNLKTGGYIKNTQPEVISINNRFENKEEQIFLDSIKVYNEKIFEHYCLICQNNHKFTKAFICNRQKSPTRLFATECLIFEEIEAGRKTDSRYVVFRQSEGKLHWQVFGKPVLCLKGKEFIVTPDDGRISYARISDRLEVFELHEIHKGLFYHPDEGIYILTFR